MANNEHGESAAVMERLDADWERRKVKLLASLRKLPLDRWLRRRR